MFHAGPPCNDDHRASIAGDGKPFTRQVKRLKDNLLDWGINFEIWIYFCGFLFDPRCCPWEHEVLLSVQWSQYLNRWFWKGRLWSSPKKIPVINKRECRYKAETPPHHAFFTWIGTLQQQWIFHKWDLTTFSRGNLMSFSNNILWYMHCKKIAQQLQKLAQKGRET